MGRDGNARRAPLLLGILLGLLVFAAGAVAAGMFLPEWRAGGLLDEEAYRARYVDLAARASFRLEAGEPRVSLVTRGPELYEPFYRRPRGDRSSTSDPFLRVEAVHEVARTGDRPEGRFGIDFSPAGRPLLLTSWKRSFTSPFAARDLETEVRFLERLLPLVLSPGESLGPARTADLASFPRRLYPILGSPGPEYLTAFSAESVVVGRMEGDVEEGVASADASLNRFLTTFWGALLALMAALALFLVLLFRSRIGMGNGALLALLSLATLAPVPGMVFGTWGMSLGLALFSGVWIFLLWCSAESLLRTTETDFTTSLDALRAGRLGPRGGRALLVGFAFGAGLAGLRLGVPALSAALPGTWPEAASVPLPVFRSYGSPVASGVELAAGVALAFALALRVLPVRWAPVAAAIVAGGLMPALTLHPWPVELAASAAFAGLLVHVCRRYGLTALLTASIVSLLLPAACFSALHLDWMPGSFAATAGAAAGLVTLGWLGLSRPAAEEVRRLAPPVFVQRIEEERRLRHEMGLLARMQRGLLPRTLPRIEGWEVAARSLLANEAGGDLYDFLWDQDGRLWVAAGDVAGHGFSCAIAQAMTKSALASLIGREKTPSAVLARADRVLRAAGPARSFTTLALLRLDPGTGQAVLANAAHPYPLLAIGRDVSEITLPSLPLGLGPHRTYDDRSLDLPPGGVLVFCSDGLFEAADRGDEPYGFERVREVLRDVAERPAEKILEALLADWRRHLRGAPPLDDTTVVVLKRTGDRG